MFLRALYDEIDVVKTHVGAGLGLVLPFLFPSAFEFAVAVAFADHGSRSESCGGNPVRPAMYSIPPRAGP